jgi:hypothetical protein
VLLKYWQWTDMQVTAVGILSLLLAASSPSAGVPVRYDQRQDGELNVHASLENFVIVLIPNNGALNLLDFIPLKKDASRHGPKQSATESNDNNVLNKYVVPSTGLKTASPYKVDLDKNSTEPIAGEVLIAQSPPVALSRTESEPPTTASPDDETPLPISTEKTNNQDTEANSDRVGAVLENTDSPDIKKDDEVKDEVTVVDSEPQKSAKLSKSIDVAAEIPRTSLKKTSEEDIPVIDFFPKSVKSFGLEYGNAELKRVRPGAEEDCRDRLGNCRHTKLR